MKTPHMVKTLSALAGLALLSAPANAGVITGWDMSNVTVTPPPYTLYETYNSTLFTDAAKKTTNGAIIWKELDTQAPGMKVVNGDDVTGANCIMGSGYNPEDGTTKMCSDPFQTSKRWKLKHVQQAPLDVYFNVTPGSTKFYGSLQKLTNATATRLQGFTVELGFMVNGQFVPSKAGDGLGFSDNRGRYFTNPVTYDPTKDHFLSALFPHEMAGPPDANHPDPGYFYPRERMYFNLTANEDSIVSTGISENHLKLLGQWLNAGAVPWGIRFDDDWDINTDNILMANCEGGFDEAAQRCLGTWVTYRSCLGLDANGEPCDSDGVRKIIPQATVDQWLAHPQFLFDVIDDLGNLSVNYFITVGDNSKWPTPHQFVVRFTPVPVESEPVTPPPSSTAVDVAITAITVPSLKVGATGDIVVTLKNELAGTASGTLDVVVKDSAGKVLNTYATSFTTRSDSTTSNFKYAWKAPSYKTTVTVTATANNVGGEIDPADNTFSASRTIK